MNSYQIITVLNDESILTQSGQYLNCDMDDVLEKERKRLTKINTIERIVVKGRGTERVLTRFDEVKTSGNLHPVFQPIINSIFNR